MESKNANCISTQVSQSVVSMSSMPRAVLEVSGRSKEACSTVPTPFNGTVSPCGEVKPTFPIMRIAQNPI